MRKIFTLGVAATLACTAMAQMPEKMTFVGASNIYVSGMSIDNPSDTAYMALTGENTAALTLPKLEGMSSIPSITIEGLEFEIDEEHVVIFNDQKFNTTVEVDGEEKAIKGEKFSGRYELATNRLQLVAEFKYGNMPFSVEVSFDAYYLKDVTNPVSVTVGGAYTYSNDEVTYRIRKYVAGDVVKVDVEMPEYTLSQTVMGDITLGAYTVQGLTYDEEKGGYYRDYKDDGLTFHFKAESNGTVTVEGDYAFNPEKDNNILVKYEGNQISQVVNTFQMGTMPFGIVSVLSNGTLGVNEVTAQQQGSSVCNLQGQPVAEKKGLVIENGRIVLVR